MACSKVACHRKQSSAEPSVFHLPGVVFDSYRGLVDIAERIGAPLTELMEDAAALFEDAIAFGEDAAALAMDTPDECARGGDDAGGEAAAQKRARRQGAASVGVALPLLTWACVAEVGRSSVVVLSGAADPAHVVCVLAAAMLASCAKSTLDQLPAERRLKKIQGRCAAALGASSVLYSVLLLPHELVLPELYRPELVLHCASDVVATPLFMVSLSTLAEQKHWQAAPAIAWALMSVGTSALAAIDPLVNTYERLAMLGLSYTCALIGGHRARQLVQCAESDENRQRSRFACKALSLSWVLSPLVQGVALFVIPPVGPAAIVPFVAMDLTFKCGIAHILLCSRSSISAVMQQPASVVLDRCKLLWGGGLGDA